jgi:small subunit ribosomal protein S6
MKREYESAVIFDGSLADDVLAQEQEKVEIYLQKNTEFTKTEVWGKRKLAYDINRKKTGFYCFFLFTADGNLADKLAKIYRLNPKVLRSLTVLYEKKPEFNPEALTNVEPVLEDEEE